MRHENYYRLWHKCLAISDRKLWAPEVEGAFGRAHGLPFGDWWARCAGRFADDEDTPPFLIDELRTKEDFAWWFDEWRDPSVDESFVVMVNVQNTKDALLAAFDKLLREKMKPKRGRPARERWGAEFELLGDLTEPNARAIEKALSVHEYIGEHPGEPGWRVAQALKINETTSAGDPSADQRKVLKVQISRYKARAVRLIDGVQRGKFPVP